MGRLIIDVIHEGDLLGIGHILNTVIELDTGAGVVLTVPLVVDSILARNPLPIGRCRYYGDARGIDILDESLDPLSFIDMVLCGNRLFVLLFLLSISLRLVIQKLLLLSSHLLLEDIDAWFLTADQSVRIIMNIVQDGSPVLVVLVVGRLIELE